ncbi:MAG: hypothetical protein GXY13_16120 [Acidimicrobiales bacterium]|nr:hypothetical protein [Acidimicrobiales bacterium]
MRAATGRPRPRLLVAIVATVLGLTAALLGGCGSDGTDDAETGTTADGTADEAPGTDDGADPPDDGTTGTTVAGATGVDCLTGEMELVSAESTAALPGVSGTDVVPTTGQLVIIRFDEGSWTMGPGDGVSGRLRFDLGGAVAEADLDDFVHGAVTADGTGVLLDAADGAPMTYRPTGDPSVEQPIAPAQILPVALPLDEPAEVSCPAGEDVTLSSATTTTVLRPLDEPVLLPDE